MEKTKRKRGKGISRIATMLLVLLFGLVLFAGCAKETAENGSEGSTESHSQKESETGEEQTKTGESQAEENQALKAFRESQFQQGRKLAIAYLGYADGEKNKEELCEQVKTSDLAANHPFLKELTADNVAAWEGSELYVLVPVSDAWSIAIYPSELTDQGEYQDQKDQPVFQGKTGQVCILRCNPSDLHANVLISVQGKTETLELHPAISLMDGRLIAEDGCQDFSLYETEDDPDPLSEAAKERLLAREDVQSQLKQGMVLLNTGQQLEVEGQECWLFSLGTDGEDQFVNEKQYAVSDSAIYTMGVVDSQWKKLED